MLFFLFIFLMSQLLRLAELLISQGISAVILAKMVFLMSLSFLPMVLPVAFLVAVLVGFGRLSADSELVALKASGLSMGRMALPVGGLASIIVVFTLLLNLNWAPWGEREFRNVLIKASNTKVAHAIREGTFTSGFFDLLIFADKVDPNTNRLKHVFLYDARKPKSPVTVVAQEGRIVSVKTGTEFGTAVMLELYNGSLHSNDRENNSYQKGEFGKYELYLKIDEGAENNSLKPTMYPYRTVVESIPRTHPDSVEGRDFRSELARRYSIALSPIIFVFLGMAFGTVRTRAVRANAALVAFLILLGYWSLQTWGYMMIHEKGLNPYFAMWLPDIVFGILAVVSFRRAGW